MLTSCLSASLFVPLLWNYSLLGGRAAVSIPYSARTDGRAIFDGHKMEVLRHGESILVETSSFPIPVINRSPYDQDWFKSIREKLQWNVRVEQKPLPAH